MSDTLFRWHDPHPGMAGALARIPGSARQAALILNGSATTADHAVEKIRKAVGAGYVVTFSELHHCIRLKEDRGYPMNCWRVLSGSALAKLEQHR